MNKKQKQDLVDHSLSQMLDLPEDDSKFLPAPIRDKAIGRPLTQLSDPVIFALAAQGFTMDMVAAACGITKQTIYNRFFNAFKEGKAARAGRVLDVNFEKAMTGDDKAIDRELKMAGLLSADGGAQVNITIGEQFQDHSDDELLDSLDMEDF